MISLVIVDKLKFKKNVSSGFSKIKLFYVANEIIVCVKKLWLG